MASDKHNDSPWFRHDANADDDPNMERLLFKYGNAGCGVYWRLAQRLRGQERLALADIPVLAKSLGYRRLKELVDDSCEWGLYERDDTHFWSNRMLREIGWAETTRQKKSEAGRKGAQVTNALRVTASSSPRQRRGSDAAQGRHPAGTIHPTILPTNQGEISSRNRSPEPESLPPAENPDPPARDGPQFTVAVEFGKRYFAKTGRPFVPIEEHFAQAARLLRQLDGDQEAALEACRRYFEESWWFTEDRKNHKPSFSFGGFCAHAPEILAAHSPPRAGPPARECPVCGCQVVGSMRSCGECGMDVGKFDDREAVEEHRRWRAERLATSKQSALS